ncbi:MAG: hypothetical protein KDC80_13875 [Saprospiraceae bacterium]|nr:hypothetical protein [Saprospiraceae bacterium]
MRWSVVLVSIILSACPVKNEIDREQDAGPTGSQAAEVLSLDISGTEGNYTFNVEVKSPDTGCDQYADWWEVLTPDTVLIYRRILTHSHVSEQPFKRSGGPVPVKADDQLIIRAHMNNLGYGKQGLQGSAASGFEQMELSSGFGIHLSEQEPLPGDCGF